MKDKHINMYMRVAQAVAETSSAVRLKVGAVAVKNNRVIGTGYNALPSGVYGSCEEKVYADLGNHSYYPQDQMDEKFPYVDDKGRFKLVTKPEVRHAEINLLLNLTKSTESSEYATVFCTHACCLYCAMSLVDSGIKKFFYKEKYRNGDGLLYLGDHGVEINMI